MSLEVEYSLRCDREGCEATVIGRGITDEATRRKVKRMARDLGWRVDERGDFCASCGKIEP